MPVARETLRFAAVMPSNRFHENPPRFVTTGSLFAQDDQRARARAEETAFVRSSSALSTRVRSVTISAASQHRGEGGVVADVQQGRWTAEIDGDFVVFIIGARINSKLHALRALIDLGGRRGMNHMLKYLSEHPEKGLLGYETAGFTTIQYWRSLERRASALRAAARSASC